MRLRPTIWIVQGVVLLALVGTLVGSWVYHRSAVDLLLDDSPSEFSAAQSRAVQRYVTGSIWARPPWPRLDTERQGRIITAALRRHADGDGDVTALVAQLAAMSQSGEQFTQLPAIAGRLAVEGEVADRSRLLLLARQAAPRGLDEHVDVRSLLLETEDPSLYATLLVILDDRQLLAHAQASLAFALRDDVAPFYRVRMLDRLAALPDLFPFDLTEAHRAAIEALAEDARISERDHAMVKRFLKKQAGDG